MIFNSKVCSTDITEQETDASHHVTSWLTLYW